MDSPPFAPHNPSIETGRDVRLEACRKTYTYGSRWLEAHYVLAGEDFYSERLRPTISSKSAESEPEPFPLPDPTDPVGGEEPVEVPPQAGA